MAKDASKRNRHFILKRTARTERFRARAGGSRIDIPAQDRAKHASALKRQFSELGKISRVAKARQQEAGVKEEGLGISIEFRSFPGIELAFESLARDNQGIELCNVRHEQGSDGKERVLATVFVPDGKLAHFDKILTAYVERKKDKIGRPRDNQRLVDAIADVRAATFRALWTDPGKLPTSNDEPVWLEIWLPVHKGRQAMLDSFRRLAKAQGIRVAAGELEFPERTVVLAYASVAKMHNSMGILNCIAEIRLAKKKRRCIHFWGARSATRTTFRAARANPVQPRQ